MRTSRGFVAVLSVILAGGSATASGPDGGDSVPLFSLDIEERFVPVNGSRKSSDTFTARLRTALQPGSAAASGSQGEPLNVTGTIATQEFEAPLGRDDDGKPVKTSFFPVLGEYSLKLHHPSGEVSFIEGLIHSREVPNNVSHARTRTALAELLAKRLSAELRRVALAGPPPVAAKGATVSIAIEELMLPDDRSSQPRPLSLFTASLGKELQSYGFRVLGGPQPGTTKIKGRVVYQPHNPGYGFGSGGAMGQQTVFPVTAELTLVVEDDSGVQRGVLVEKLSIKSMLDHGLNQAISYDRTAFDLVSSSIVTIAARLQGMVGAAPKPKPFVLLQLAETGRDHKDKAASGFGLEDQLRRALQKAGATVLVNSLAAKTESGRVDPSQASCVVTGNTFMKEFNKPGDPPPFRLETWWSVLAKDPARESPALFEGKWNGPAQDLKSKDSWATRQELLGGELKGVIAKVLEAMPTCVPAASPPAAQ